MDPTQTAQSSPPPTLEDLARRRMRLMLLPIIYRYITTSPAPQTDQPRQVLILINSRARTMVVMEDTDGNQIFPSKDGRVPASKESIEALPAVKVEEQGLDCAICLSEFGVGGEAKKMPCNHMFHAVCIDKWLGIQGSCPVCRHRMPETETDGNTDGDEAEEREEEDGDGGEGGEDEESGAEDARAEWLATLQPFAFTFYFADRNLAVMTVTNSGHGSGEAHDGSEEVVDDDDSDSDGSSAEDMEVDDGGSVSHEADMEIDGNDTS